MSVTHIEMETAQNETKQTEAAPDDSSASASASAGGKDDRQNDRSTSAFLDLRSNPNHVGTSSLPNQILKGKTGSFQVTWIGHFKWLHYSPELNALVCYYCAKANSLSLLSLTKNSEHTFISTGFTYCKNALQRFSCHEQSACHRHAILQLE